VRDPSALWDEIAGLRRRLESASGEEAAALRQRLKEVKAEAAVLDARLRPDEMRLELAVVEGELAELDERRIGGRTRKRNFLMGFLWGDHDSGDHLAELNRKLDAAGGRPGLEERRRELRERLGLE